MADIQREVMDMDVLFVGAGPSCLAGAYHLARLIKEHNEAVDAGKQGAKIALENGIAVLEKGKNVGDHMLSGAVVDPIGIKELFPDYRDRAFPIEAEVIDEAVYMMTSSGKLKFPILPPSLKNHGNYICSLNKIAQWMNDQIVADFGDQVNVFPEFPGREVLYDGNRVIGIRTGDKGIDHDGKQKSTFEAGVDIHAKVTILGEGPRGSLTKHLVPRLGLDKDRNPQVYGTGVKEIWELPAGRLPKGMVIHTAGWPLESDHYGGSWLYMMSETTCSIGFVSALDYANPTFDPHGAFNRFKTHPYIAGILEGGKMTGYGAKTVSEGGYWSMPQLYADGVLLVGESGGFVNISRLKGIHLAIKSGMMAAEATFEALKVNDYSASTLKKYDELYRTSWAHEEMWKARNWRQNFTGGFHSGMIKSGIQIYLTAGGTKKRQVLHADHEHMEKNMQKTPTQKVAADEKKTFAKLTDVYFSGTKHEENQPCHLVIAPEDIADICNTRCKEEYGNPCQHFCPAQVYNMIVPEEGKPTRLRIDFSNCVHCKTCDIADPYQVINWVTPEGGGGPVYKNL